MPTFKNTQEISRYLNSLIAKAQIDEIFSTKFMRAHTEFDSFSSWLIAGGFECHSKADFEKIPTPELNKYVRISSKFSSWQDLLNAATADYLHARGVPIKQVK